MKYFLDTEFLEGTQKKLFGETKPTIDLISIGIVCEDGREYYAISKDFNLKEAWNRWQQRTGEGDRNNIEPKEYWIRENVLKPIWEELYTLQYKESCKLGAKTSLLLNKFEKENNLSPNSTNHVKFTYENFKKLINKYGKTNKQIAEEIVQFVDARWIEEGNVSKGFMYPGGTSIEEVKTTNVQFYGYYCDYDWVAFCWLFGKMIDLPKHFPMYCVDLKQMLDVRYKDGYYYMNYIPVDDTYPSIIKSGRIDKVEKHPDYPKQTNEHSAIHDARWNFELYKFLTDTQWI